MTELHACNIGHTAHKPIWAGGTSRKLFANCSPTNPCTHTTYGSFNIKPVGKNKTLLTVLRLKMASQPNTQHPVRKTYNWILGWVKPGGIIFFLNLIPAFVAQHQSVTFWSWLGRQRWKGRNKVSQHPETTHVSGRKIISHWKFCWRKWHESM